MSQWFRCDPSAADGDRFVIQVKAKPRSRRNAVLGLLPDGAALEVAVTAPPVDGEANEALIDLLADALGVRKSALSIVRGGQSRFKQIMITGVTETELRSLERR